MEEISVHDIVLQFCRWVNSPKCVARIAEIREVSTGRAYQLLKEALKIRDDRERVWRYVLPDGSRWYGVIEFGPFLCREFEDEKIDDKALKDIWDDIMYDVFYGR